MKLPSLLSSAFLILFGLYSCFQNQEISPDKIPNDKTLQDYLLNGWNTWNNPDLLNHVYMPEGLSIKLNFRKNYNSDLPYYMNSSFFSGPENNFSGKIRPFLHYYDASYTDLRISWDGLEARIQTATDYEDLLILYTPEKTTGNKHILILEAGILWGKPGLIEKKYNFIQAEMGNLVYSIRTTGADLEIPLPVASPYFSFDSDEEIAIFTGKTRSLELIKKIMVKRDERNRARSKIYGDMSEIYMAMHNVLSWNTIYDPFNNRYITSSNRYLNESRGGYLYSGNDMFFTAAMFALDNKWGAYSNAIALTNSINKEGFIPGYTCATDKNSSPEWSQPPVGSLICMLIYNKYKDKWFLREVYEKLLTWNRWWENNRSNKGYLSWGCNPIVASKNTDRTKSALMEADQYGSPCFENVVFNPETNMLELASVDLISLYIADCKNLAEIADIIGKESEKNELLSRAEKYSRKLQELWDKESGLYRDKDLISNEFTGPVSLTAFYPLVAEVPTKEQAQLMIDSSLLNENEFFREYMIPYISANDPSCSDTLNFSGRINGKMNFLIYLGLKKYGYTEACKTIAGKSANLLLKQWIQDRKTYDFYNNTTGEGNNIITDNALSTHGGLLSLIALMDAGYW